MEEYSKIQQFKILCLDALDEFIREDLEEPLNYEKLRQKKILRKPIKKMKDFKIFNKRRKQ